MTPGQRACGVAVRAAPTGSSAGPGRQDAISSDLDRLPAQVATVRWAVLQVLPICVGSLGSAGALSIGVVAGIVQRDGTVIARGEIKVWEKAASDAARA